MAYHGSSDRILWMWPECWCCWLKDLNRWGITVKFVSQLLIDEQKQQCVCVPGIGWSRKWPKYPLEDQNGKLNKDFLLWPRKQTADLLVEKPILSTSKESQVRLVELKNVLFICFGCDGTIHYEFIFPGQVVNQHTTRRFCSDWKSKSTENIWNDGGIWTGCFIMTVCWHTLLYQCSNFWLLTTWLWSSTPVTPLICLLVISSSFWDWSHSYKILVFSIPLKFRNSCRPSYVCFQEVSSSSISSVAETGSIT